MNPWTDLSQTLIGEPWATEMFLTISMLVFFLTYKRLTFERLNFVTLLVLQDHSC